MSSFVFNGSSASVFNWVQEEEAVLKVLEAQKTGWVSGKCWCNVLGRVGLVCFSAMILPILTKDQTP